MQVLTIGLIFALLVGCLLTHEEIGNGKISPDKLKEDVEFLFENIEQIHPNPYGFTDKRNVYEMKKQLIQDLDEPMDSIEFYKKLAPIIVELNDGHTFIVPPVSKHLEKIKLFPLDIVIIEDKVLVKNDYSSTIQRGSELLSLNNIPIRTILNQLLRYISSETRGHAIAQLQRFFPLYLSIEFGLPDKFSTKVKNSEIKIVEIPSVCPESMEGSWLTLPPYSYRYLEGYKVGILTMRSMENPKEFEEWLKDIFPQLREKDADLIIDLRDCQGGNSVLGDMVISYISEKDLHVSGGESYSKVSEQLKKQRDYEWLQNAKIGDVIEEMLEEFVINTRGFGFNGNVSVLTSPFTYSSADGFVKNIKEFDLGRIVGEETGSVSPRYGDNVIIVLPNSKISVGIATRYMPSDEKTGGVIPDYEVKPKPDDLITGEDRVLNFVLEELIGDNYQNNTSSS